MNLRQQNINVMAYSEDDAWRQPPAKVASGNKDYQRGVLHKLPCVQLKKQMENINHLRIGSWNVGSLTGKGQELVGVMQRRKVDILCVQETRWKGNSMRNLGNGYRVFHAGESTQRNGVGIILSEMWVDKVVSVKRVSDRLINIKVVIDRGVWNIMLAYAPQAGCSVMEKDKFIELVEDESLSLPANENLVIGGDLNAHLGSTSLGFREPHGQYGYGNTNEGEKWLECLQALDLHATNTGFQKREQQ